MKGLAAGAIGGSSPHTRGAPRLRAAPGFPVGIIPAYAGSTFTALAAQIGVEDHPRIRGEHCHRSRLAPPIWDHPRIRGEHWPPPPPVPGPPGSSPHTRGALSTTNSCVARARIIPAYAGSTGCVCSPRVGCRDHPRIRGEHAAVELASSVWAGSSPHTRGALVDAIATSIGFGIIPAYAGSTEYLPQGGKLTMDHPRIRGEHRRSDRRADLGVGSSPHTRGAHDGAGVVRVGRRIIPAYAGSTVTA